MAANHLFWCSIEIIWFRLWYIIALITPITFRVNKIDKSQNPPTNNNIQIRILEAQVNHPRISKTEKASILCRQKTFSTRDARLQRNVAVDSSQTIVYIVILWNARDQYSIVPLFFRKRATKKHKCEFSTTNMVLFRIYRSFRNTIILVYHRCGRRLVFSYIFVQSRKLLHFS